MGKRISQDIEFTVAVEHESRSEESVTRAMLDFAKPTPLNK
jgi:hypothetical protein